MNESTSPNPELLNVKTLSEILDVSERTLWRMRDMGKMPPPIRLGALVRWRRADIEAWIADGCRPVRASRGVH